MSESTEAVLWFLVICIGAWFLFFADKIHKEESGTVSYNTCKQKVYLTASEYPTAPGTFICSDNKTNSGKSMGGECVRIVLNDNTGDCDKAYVYYREADIKCETNSYLTVNDECSPIKILDI